eukprot:5640-Heterococcus_DN1.PRE.2
MDDFVMVGTGAHHTDIHLLNITHGTHVTLRTGDGYGKGISNVIVLPAEDKAEASVDVILTYSNSIVTCIKVSTDVLLRKTAPEGTTTHRTLWTIRPGGASIRLLVMNSDKTIKQLACIKGPAFTEIEDVIGAIVLQNHTIKHQLVGTYKHDSMIRVYDIVSGQEIGKPVSIGVGGDTIADIFIDTYSNVVFATSTWLPSVHCWSLNIDFMNNGKYMKDAAYADWKREVFPEKKTSQPHKHLLECIQQHPPSLLESLYLVRYSAEFGARKELLILLLDPTKSPRANGEYCTIFDIGCDCFASILTETAISALVYGLPDVCMKPEWFAYTILYYEPKSSMSGDLPNEKSNDTIKEGLTLLTPTWQRQAQHKLLMMSAPSDDDTDGTINASATPLHLDYTTLATVMNLPCITDIYYNVAVEFLLSSTEFVSLDALANVHSTQSLQYNVEGDHIIKASPNLMSKPVSESLDWKDTISYSGTKRKAQDATRQISSDGLLVATAVVPVHAGVSLDLLESVMKLSEKQNSSRVFAADIVGAIIELHWNLYAESYWNMKANHAFWTCHIAGLVYYALHIGLRCKSDAPSISSKKLCWELLELVISWGVLTYTAFRLETKPFADTGRMKRVVCLAVYYWWGLLSSVLLLSSRVQTRSECSSISIATITAVVLSWLATCIICYVACKEAIALVLRNAATVAEYKQAGCLWLFTCTCDASSVQSEKINTADYNDDIAAWQVLLISIVVLPGAVVFKTIMYDMLCEAVCIITNAMTSTASSVAKWRQQQAYMIQASYRECSVEQKTAIDAYLTKNCYIQVLQPQDTQPSTVVAATEATEGIILSTGATASAVGDSTSAPGTASTIGCVDIAIRDEINTVKADVKALQSSAEKTQQLLSEVLAKL